MTLYRQIRAIARPATAWALHFIAVYALISAACAPRLLLSIPQVHVWGGILTVIALGVSLWSSIRPPRGSPEMRRAAFWAGLIFSATILFDAAFLYFFDSCGG
ncbi:MAG: hypothetical protein HUJ24_12430 [Rhodobacteraceae bacterium]|nr:hypothetical protein [Paracoccaceae bacterium]